MVEKQLLLSPRDAAQVLGISERKLWGMTFQSEERFPFIRMGRCVRYPVDDLQRWIDDRKEGGDE